MAELKNWRPIRDTHAIQAALFTVQFGEPAGDVLLRRVDSEVGVIAASLGLRDRQPIQAMPFPFLMPAGMQAVAMDQGAVYANRNDSGELVEQLTISRESVKYEQFLYTRWAPFRERAEKLMKSVIDQYGAFASLAVITSAYVDVFELNADADADVREVIGEESAFVARGAHQKSSPWHSHSGFFEYPDPITRRLIQVNIDVQGEIAGSAQTVRIVTQIADQFSQPDVAPLDPALVNWEFIVSHADEQHPRLKGLLEQVLTSNAARAISLA